MIFGLFVVGVFLGVGVSGWFIVFMVVGSFVIGVLVFVLEWVFFILVNGSVDVY